MGAALVFAAVDFLANTSPHYHFGTLYAKGQPMELAADSSGFNKDVPAANGRHVLVVVVEALGHFADPFHQAVLMKAFDDLRAAQALHGELGHNHLLRLDDRG